MKLNSPALLTASSLFLAAFIHDQTSETTTADVAAPTTSDVEATIDPSLATIVHKFSYSVGITVAI